MERSAGRRMMVMLATVSAMSGAWPKVMAAQIKLEQVQIGGQVVRSVDSLLLHAGDVVTVSGAALRRSGARSLGDALTGKVPGMQAFTASGNFGALPAVQLRGTYSLGSFSAPLVLVDGVPMNVALNHQRSQYTLSLRAASPWLLTDFPLADVDHIVIMRGATASALHGPRAFNGVIDIRTIDDNAPVDFPDRPPPAVYVSQRVGLATRATSLGARRFTRAESGDTAGWDACRGFCDHEEDFFGGVREVRQTDVTARVLRGGSSARVTFSNRAEGLPVRGTSGDYLAGRLGLAQRVGTRLSFRLDQLISRTDADLPLGEGRPFSGYGSEVWLVPSFTPARPAAGVPFAYADERPGLVVDTYRSPRRLTQWASNASLDARLVQTRTHQLAVRANAGVHRLAQRDSVIVPRGDFRNLVASDWRERSAHGSLEHVWGLGRTSLATSAGYQYNAYERSVSEEVTTIAGDLGIGSQFLMAPVTMRGL